MRPSIVLIIDNAGAMRSAHDDLVGLRFLERFNRLALDGPAFGIHVAISGDRPQAFPPPVAAASTQRLVLYLPDAYDYALCGLKVRVPGEMVPGRGFTTSGLELQLAWIPPDVRDVTLGEIGSGIPGHVLGERAPKTIGALPGFVSGEVLGPALITPSLWTLPFGVGDRDLAHRSLHFHDGDHLLIAGPARSGKTTLLASLGTRAAGAAVKIITVSPRSGTALNGRFADAGTAFIATTGGAELIDALRRTEGHPTLVLVDDAESIDDEESLLATLVVASCENRRVVAAGRADRLRSTYGHWTRRLRDGRLGFALHPDLDTDGDLWSVRFTSLRGHLWPPGRGVLIQDGEIEVVQSATP